MAGGTINKKNLIDEDAIRWPEELVKHIKILIGVQDDLVVSAKKYSELSKSFKTSSTDKEFVKLKQEEAKVTQAAVKQQIALEKANQAAIQTNLKLKQSEEAKRKSIVASAESEEKAIRSKNATAKSEISLSEAQRRQKEALVKSSERTARALEKENREYTKLNNKLRIVRERVEDLNAKKISGLKLSDIEQKELKQSQREYDKLEKSIRKVDERNNKHQRSVGRYPKLLGGAIGSLKSFAGALGLVGGATAVFSIIRNGLKIFSRFEKETSNLKAVLGATSIEMTLLTSKAKELGASTAFTARQVIELETSFAKLGFPTSDILEMTEATLNASSAMGSDLGETAKLTGATLKSFGLDADEATRVTDVLAKSTSISALDFEKLSTSMSTIAPVAKSYGFSLEATISLLGQLSNAGFDASTAATATRKILLNLSDTNGKLAKSLKEPVTDLPSLVAGLKQLKNEGVDLGKALELTDVRSVAAFSTFLEGTETLTDLNISLENAAGSAERMAKVQLDNLAGDVTILNSAWQGLILAVTTGSGAFSKALRGMVSSATEFINVLTADAEGREVFITKQATDNAKETIKELVKLAKESGKTIKEQSIGFIDVESEKKRIDELKKELEKLEERFIKDKISTDNKFVNKKKREISLIEQQFKITNKLLALEIEKEKEASKPKKKVETEGEKKESEKQEKERVKRLEAEKKALFELGKFKKEQQLQQLNDQIKDESKSLEQRLSLIAEKYTKEKELEVFIRDFKLSNSKLIASERELIEQQSQDKIGEIQAKNIKESFNARLQNLKDIEDEQNKLADKKVTTVLESVGSDTSSIQAAEDEIKKIRIEAAEEVFNKKIDFIGELFATENITAEQLKQVDDELRDIKLENAQILLNNSKEKAAEQVKTEQEKAAKIRDVFISSSNSIAETLNIDADNIINIYDGLFDKLEEGETKFERFAEIGSAAIGIIGDISANISEAKISEIDAEIQANEDKYTRLLELAQGDKTQTELLEKEREIKRKNLEKDKRKEQVKQAKFGKALAITNIILTTAQAVIGALAPPPVGLGPVAGIPLAVVAGALGVAQLGVAIARPIPKFKEGVQNFGGGMAVLGDGGVPEVITDKNDNILGLSPSKDTLFDLPKGANVYSSVDTFKEKNNVNDDLLKLSILHSLKQDQKQFDNKMLSKSMDRNYKELEGKITKGINNGFKKVKFTINNNIDTVDQSYYNSGLY